MLNFGLTCEEARARDRVKQKVWMPRLVLLLQTNKELIAKVFRLQTEVSRLRADVNRLGSARDTVEHRHKVESFAYDKD
jgi:uncharacterized protein YlxW (UPF0749 family)